MSEYELRRIRRLLDLKYDTLFTLEEREAKYGPLAPVYLESRIRDLGEEIRQLDSKLRKIESRAGAALGPEDIGAVKERRHPVRTRRPGEYFVGRDREIELFRSALDTGLSLPRILAFLGMGGIGKTTLLEKFGEICYTGDVAFALVDGQVQNTVVDVVRSFHDQLGPYLICSAPKEYDNLDDQLNRYAVLQSTDDVGELERLPLTSEDVEFLVHAESHFTLELAQNINLLAQGRPVVLMLDTYEMIPQLDSWLCQGFLPQLCGNTLIVIAGRNPLGSGWRKWLASMKVTRLSDFSHAEAEQYIGMVASDRPDLTATLSRQCQEVVHFAGGLPLALSLALDLLAEAPYTDFSVSPEKQGVVGALIRQIVRDPTSRLRADLMASSVLRWFNESSLAAVLGNRSDAAQLYRQFQTFSFVKWRPDGLAFHDTVRASLLEHLKWESLDRYRALNRVAIAFYTDQMALKDNPNGQKHGLEKLYHLGVEDEGEAVHFFDQQFTQALNRYQLDYCNRLLDEVRAVALKKTQHQNTVMHATAQLAYNRNQWKEAEEIYSRLLPLLDLNPRLKARVGTELGIVHYYEGHYGEAISIFRDAIDLQERLGEREQMAHTLTKLGKAYRLQGRVEEALECQLRGLKIFRSTNNSHEIALILVNLASAFIVQGKWQAAIDYLTEALSLHTALYDEREVPRVLRYLGLAYTMKGAWEQGVAYNLESIDLCSQLGDDYHKGIALVNLGDAYRFMDRWADAARSYQESMAISERLQYVAGLGVAMSGYALTVAHDGDTGRAIELLGRSIQIRQDVDCEYGIATTMNELGLLYSALGQNGTAHETFSAALTNASGHGPQEFEIARALLYLARIDSATNPVEAEQYLERAEGIAKKMEFHDLLAESALLRAEPSALATDAADYSYYLAEAIVQAKQHHPLFARRILKLGLAVSDQRASVANGSSLAQEGRWESLLNVEITRDELERLLGELRAEVH